MDIKSIEITNIEIDNNIPDIYKQIKMDGYIKYPEYNNLIKDVISIINPSSILEIGFFLGCSSFLWLYNSTAQVLSVDPMYNKYVPRNVDLSGHFISLNNLASVWRERLQFFLLDSAKLLQFIKNQSFDLFFIDGDHTVEGIDNDLQIACNIDCPYVLIDDAQPDGPHNQVYNLFIDKYSDKFEIIKYYKLPNSDCEWNVILAKRR
jgi:hypothetical protein